MLASPKMYNSTEVIGSYLRVNDLGISTLFSISSFHFSHLILIVWALIHPTRFLAHISLCAISYRLDAQAILIPLGHSPRLTCSSPGRVFLFHYCLGLVLVLHKLIHFGYYFHSPIQTLLSSTYVNGSFLF